MPAANHVGLHAEHMGQWRSGGQNENEWHSCGPDANKRPTTSKTDAPTDNQWFLCLLLLLYCTVRMHRQQRRVTGDSFLRAAMSAMVRRNLIQ